MVFAIDLKKCFADADILSIIVEKFCYRKKLCPIILLEVDKNLKIDIHYTILFFGLLIYLGVKNGGNFLLDAKKIA